jgi:hypothetical protein
VQVLARVAAIEVDKASGRSAPGVPYPDVAGPAGHQGVVGLGDDQRGFAKVAVCGRERLTAWARRCCRQIRWRVLPSYSPRARTIPPSSCWALLAKMSMSG